MVSAVRIHPFPQMVVKNGDLPWWESDKKSPSKNPTPMVECRDMSRPSRRTSEFSMVGRHLKFAGVVRKMTRFVKRSCWTAGSPLSRVRGSDAARKRGHMERFFRCSTSLIPL